MSQTKPDSVSAAPSPDVPPGLRQALAEAGGWLRFDRFMALALYAPGWGYYTQAGTVFGRMPQSGSDFVTAPEMTPLFGRTLALQVAEGLDASGSTAVWEFGAGSGALAEQLLDALGDRVTRYGIIDLSGALRQRQQQRLARFGARVCWFDRLPDELPGVIVGNEVLDAMPVRLLHFDGEGWWERGVSLAQQRLAFADRPTDLRPPVEGPFMPGTVTEVGEQAQAFVRTLAAHMTRTLALFIDYGFPQAEYYHPQRSGGTLMCHRGHRADADPLVDIGHKDITAHVDFTAIALAAQDAGLDVLGYTSQGRFLLNAGITGHMAAASLAERSAAQRLVHEHEMGELFKVLAIGRGLALDPLGFAAGDRMHRL